MTRKSDRVDGTVPGGAREGSPGPLPRPRVLLIDDDLALLDVLSAALEEAGCAVLVATTGEAGSAVAAHARPDLIVLDVSLPGEDGFTTCARLTSEGPTRGTPVILLTSMDAADGARLGRAAGAADYIEKRPPWTDVARRIRGHLAP